MSPLASFPIASAKLTAMADATDEANTLLHETARRIGDVGNAFEELRRGVKAVTNRGPQLLRLHCAPSFAAQWLSPQLPGFLAAHSDISVRLAASTEYAAFVTDEFDADIVYGQPRGNSISVIPICEETVTPLCCPDIAAAILTVADLDALTLIQSDRKQVRWHDWFAANGVEGLRQASGMRFDRSFLAIAAAADGLGVALESTLFAERELRSGRLVAPLLDRAENIRYVGHHLIVPKAGEHRRTVRIFSQWLAMEFGRSTSDR